MSVNSSKFVLVNSALTGRPGGVSKGAQNPARNRRRKEGRKEGEALPLGDLVERVAKPIALRLDEATKTLPKRWRTKLAGCSACSRRRRLFNALVPDVRNWRHWLLAVRVFPAAYRAIYSQRKAPGGAANEGALSQR